MADTIVNTTPSSGDNSGNGVSFLVGIIIFAVLVFLFFVYGLPLIRGAAYQGTPNSSSGVNVQVPKQVDVNVKSDK